MALLGCPFCRELVPDDEGDTCAVCGVKLIPVDRLPLSYEARAALAAQIAATPPEHRTLPITYLRRCRGPLLAAALLGLCFFFAPWILMSKPDEYIFSGLDLARHRTPWFWGGAVGWFIMIPLVVTRRTIAQMRGVRAIVTLFATLTLVEVVFLIAKAPAGTRYVPLEYAWGWGLYASGLTSIVGIACGIFFGGRIDDIELPNDSRENPLERTPAETSEGHTLH